jgi:hypothetical protein
MPMPRRKHIPKATRRRALELLASSCRDGCTEAVMLAHGFTVDMLVEIINTGLASASTERVVAGGRTMEVTRVRIGAMKWILAAALVLSLNFASASAQEACESKAVSKYGRPLVGAAKASF